MDVIGAVRLAVDRYRLLPRGAGVVIAVSGGPDSLCLLHVLRTLRPEFGLRLVVAHLNHGLRGSEADADAAFVRDLARQWGLPAVVEHRDVRALARERKLSIEEAARQARYAFLAGAALHAGADRIALGHNADDQAETVLMHWLRGAGVAGLRGMTPAAPFADLRLAAEPGLAAHLTLVRPLLDITRNRIEAYCRANGLQPRVDASNLDVTYFRNRLRHELLPYLERFNPNVREALRRTGAIAAADYEVLRDQVDRAWTDAVRRESRGAIAFDLAKWRALSTALQRSTLRRAVETLRRGLRDVGWEHIENAVWIGREHGTGARATLPGGLALTVGYEDLTVGDASAQPGAEEEPPFPWLAGEARVTLPGETPLPRSPWCIQAELLPADAETRARAVSNPEPHTAYLDADAVGTLEVRPRRPGDRFRPLGLGGSKSVREFLIDEKVPAGRRDSVPVFVAACPEPAIVWIAGLRVDERFKVRPQTQRILRLRLTRPAEKR